MSEPRRLYRDPRNGMLAGVAAGLAEYLHADPTVVRVGFAAAAALGLATRGVLTAAVVAAYLLMWLLMPKKPDELDPVLAAVPR